MSDLISRQAAIDALVKRTHLTWEDLKIIYPMLDVLEKLSSAQSERPSEVQDILNYLDTVLHPIVSPEHWNVYAELHDMISMLPSVQSERKMGHWIEITSSNHTYKCSVCGRLLVNITDGKNNVAKNYPYCHCGAYMRGEENE